MITDNSSNRNSTCSIPVVLIGTFFEGGGGEL